MGCNHPEPSIKWDGQSISPLRDLRQRNMTKDSLLADCDLIKPCAVSPRSFGATSLEQDRGQPDSRTAKRCQIKWWLLTVIITVTSLTVILAGQVDSDTDGTVIQLDSDRQPELWVSRPMLVPNFQTCTLPLSFLPFRNL